MKFPAFIFLGLENGVKLIKSIQEQFGPESQRPDAEYWIFFMKAIFWSLEITTNSNSWIYKNKTKKEKKGKQT